MEKLPVCRVCLNENVKYLIENTQLQNVYEKLTSIPLQTSDMRPRSVCHICYAHLLKTHKFMLTCLKVKNGLTQTVNQQPDWKREVDHQPAIDISCVNTSKFSLAPVEHHNIYSDDDIIKQEIKHELDEMEDIHEASMHLLTKEISIKTSMHTENLFS